MREWLTKDFWWKFVSVILAVAVWVTIHKYREETYQPGAPSVENTYGNVSVSIVSQSGDVSLYRVIPNTVSVTVTGSRDEMGSLQANEIRAYVDLTDLKDAKDAPVQVSTPERVTLLHVEPPRVGIILPPAKQ
ncbi:MAG TPA: CdaR family protein [Verrucomicrobiae bacterium]|nr:CdaR family protein [Verrucomicrobiae bacterium]